MKTVCIIGAGPAGLVAAKTFLQTGGFKVTIYEQSHHIGGIWAFEKNSMGNGGYMRVRLAIETRFARGRRINACYKPYRGH